MVEAWDKPNIDPIEAANWALAALHHPYFASDSSKLQTEMFASIKEWSNSHGEEKAEVMNRLTKDSVRAQRNTVSKSHARSCS